MSRNQKWRTPTVTGKDGWRYYWIIFPCSDAGFGAFPPELQMLPAEFLDGELGGMIESLKADSLPFGAMVADTMKLKLDLSEILGSDLYGFLTDDGAWVIGGLFANTVWTLHTDRGDDEMFETDFHVEYQGVQVYYLGQEFNISDDGLSMQLELVHAGKVTLENTSTVGWSEQVQSKIGALLGDDDITFVIRDRLYDEAYRDSVPRVYAFMERRFTDGGDITGDEVIAVRVEDLFIELETILGHTYSKICRHGFSTFSLTSTSNEQGTPYDFVSHWRKDLTAAGGKGALLGRAEKYWPCFAKEIGSPSAPTGGLLHPSDGLCKEFTECFSMLKAMTEDGACRSFMSISYDEGVYHGQMLFSQLWDGETVIGSGSIPSTDAFDGTGLVKRGANCVGGCTVTVRFPRGNDRKEYKHSVGGRAGGAAPYAISALVTSMPGKDTDENIYYVRMPSINVDVEEEGDGSDFAGDVATEKIIVARSGFTFPRWLYLQENSAGGGPAWITSGQSLLMRVHHHVEYDFGGLAGTYAVTGTTIALPTLETTDYTDHGSNYYGLWVELLRAAMDEQQRLALKCLAQPVGEIFSNRSQSTIKVKVDRPNCFSSTGPHARYAFNPATLKPGFLPQLATDSTIIEITTNHDNGEDEITFFVRPTSM